MRLYYFRDIDLRAARIICLFENTKVVLKIATEGFEVERFKRVTSRIFSIMNC